MAPTTASTATASANTSDVPATTTPWSWLPGPIFPNSAPASDRVRSRKLWAGEAIFARGALQKPGRADIMVHVEVEAPTSHPLTHSHVRAAVRKLRWEHPSVASKILWNHDYSDGKYVYEAPASEGDVDAWLDAVVYLKEAGPAGVDARMQEELTRLGRLDTKRTNDEFQLYHFTPNSTSDPANKHIFVMYLRHTLFDGVGSWEAMGSFLSELALVLAAPVPNREQLQWGAELTRLARAVPDRIGAEGQWSQKDLHGNWPLVKKMKEVLARPSTSFGIPYPSTKTPQLGMEYSITKFPPSILKGVLTAAREHKVKLFATQFAMNIIACMRASPPPLSYPPLKEGERSPVGENGEHRITLPYNAVNLRPLLSTTNTKDARELVSAIGFNTIDAHDLARFRSAATGSDQDILDAIWALARETQAQLVEQAAWDAQFVKCAPVVIGTLAGALKTIPPKFPMQTPQITNTGAVEAVVKRLFPIPSSQEGMRVTFATLHNVILHFACHTYTWGGELWYSYSVPTTANGHQEPGWSSVEKYKEELERITTLVAKDVNTQSAKL
ncbi:hypothetical protein HWV62_7481 [Athelia sp. TMB]|nr:hypothetical protein HWV62_7481 [Athelia sp. TMB]